MIKLLDEVLDRTGNELTGAISDSVLKTVEALFGQKMYEIGEKNATPAPLSFAVNVILTQGDGHARLRLVFDRHLLATLVADFYPKEALRNAAVLKDAASEITNIVCNKIKAFVNQKGFVIEMGFPEAEAVEPSATCADGTVSLNFSLVGNTLSISNVLHVDMS